VNRLLALIAIGEYKQQFTRCGHTRTASPPLYDSIHSGAFFLYNFDSSKSDIIDKF